MMGVKGERVVCMKLKKVCKWGWDWREGGRSVDELGESGLMGGVVGMIDRKVGVESCIVGGEKMGGVGGGG